jgi:PTH1 family peptidyl-tRNA hydrolase
MVTAELARRWSVTSWKTKDDARQAHVRGSDCILVEPQSYMNDSGVPARLVAAFYRVPAERMLVVFDDMDLPFGKLRMRERGSSGGHNGIKSIIQYFGEGFPRLKIGIGRSAHADAIGRVLGNFGPEEQPDLERILAAAADACELWLARGFTPAANAANGWLLHPPAPPPPTQLSPGATENGKIAPEHTR